MGLFGKEILTSDVLSGLVDTHSHILPGVDDGVHSTRHALETLSWMEAMGVKKITLTPHIMADYPSNTPGFLRPHFEQLRGSYGGAIELSLGAEYMLYASFDEILDSNDLLPVTENHLLVETSYMSCPINFHELLDNIHSKGYHIVLAHPERYLYMDIKEYTRLKEKDIKFQLNIGSLLGSYGDSTKRIAKKLLERGYYDCIGSDLHDLRYFQKITGQSKLPEKLVAKLDLIKGGDKLL